MVLKALCCLLVLHMLWSHMQLPGVCGAQWGVGGRRVGGLAEERGLSLSAGSQEVVGGGEGIWRAHKSNDCQEAKAVF